MTLAPSLPAAPSVAAYRFFSAQVAGVRRLSPSYVRVTFGGPDLVYLADNGYDQRIKLVLGRPEECGLARRADWYAAWSSLPAAVRPPLRTYTVRAARPALGEVDVDLVLHGATGPASRWAESAAIGDTIGLVGPDSRWPGEHGGREFRPPAGTRTLLLAGDETAVPALSAIVERLPLDAIGEVLLEVPEAGDVLPLLAPPGVRVKWLPRSGAALGVRLESALRSAVSDRTREPRATAVEAENDELLWEVPDAANGDRYAWLAGEAGVMRRLRRILLEEAGLDRASLACMGYWKVGAAQP